MAGAHDAGTVARQGRTMSGIISRVLVRVALVAASLAWAGFVFTHTVGDPGRGERIATAVLDDDDARAEVVAPISTAIMNATGLPEDQRPLVIGRVDGLLRDPEGARAFIDPFAGSWARLLGEDDSRPSEVDVAPLLDDLSIPELDAFIESSTAVDGAADVAGTTDAVAGELVAEMPATAVPLPRVELGWMAGLRRAISGTVVPLALLAVGCFAVAFAIGDRRRVLRRAGVWGVAAGLVWAVVPWLAVVAARKWATGADSVISVALEEAVSGLRLVAVLLVVGGAAAVAASFAPVFSLAGDGDDIRRDRRDRRGARAVRPSPSRSAPLAAATAQMPATPPRRTPMYEPPGRARRPITPTVEMPATSPASESATATDTSIPDPNDDHDALWDYYSS